MQPHQTEVRDFQENCLDPISLTSPAKVNQNFLKPQYKSPGNSCSSCMFDYFLTGKCSPINNSLSIDCSILRITNSAVLYRECAHILFPIERRRDGIQDDVEVIYVLYVFNI